MAILLCSINENVRARWQDLLGKRPTLHARTVSELTSILAEKEIDLLLLHRSMVDKETTADLHRTTPKCKIFLFTDRPDEDEGLEFLKIGIVGYANTYISPARLAQAIQVVMSGSVWIGQAVMQRLIQETIGRGGDGAETSKHSSPDRKVSTLTAREKEIAELVAKGQANLEIAYTLNITERTVKAHLSSIYSKTGTGSRLNLALLLNRSG